MIRHLQRFGVLALCAGLLWFAVDWQAAAALLGGADLRWLVAAVALLVAQIVLSAERWRITAAGLGIPLARTHAMREYFLAQIVNQSLPGGVLGDANRALRSKGEGGLLPAAQAVIFERLTGQVALLALLSLGLALSLSAPAVSAAPRGLSAALLAILFLATTASFFIMRHFVPRRGRVARLMADFTQVVCTKPVWRRQVGLSLGTAFCNIGAFAACAWAIGVELSLLSAITLVPLILFAMLLPLSIGGWGLREGAAAALFPLWGASPEAGLATSVAFGVMILVSVTPFFAIGRMEPKRAPKGERDLR